MRIAEQNFLKCKGSRREREHKKPIFKNARNVFDKYLRQTERAYRLSVAVDIESLSTQKPNDFWDKINSLGPKRKVNSIPIEIVDACGHTVTDENAVFERWKNDFCNFYNAPNTQEFDDFHYDMQNAQTYQRIEYARPSICSECFLKRQCVD